MGKLFKKSSCGTVTTYVLQIDVMNNKINDWYETVVVIAHMSMDIHLL